MKREAAAVDGILNVTDCLSKLRRQYQLKGARGGGSG